MDYNFVLNQAIVAARNNRPDVGLSLLEQAAKEHPRVWQIHYNLGNLLKSTGRLNDAIAAYGRAVRIAPKEAVIRINLGNTLLSVGDFAGAEKHFTSALRVDPKSASAYHGYGVALGEQHKHQLAENALARAVTLAPDFAEAHVALADILLRKGDYENGWGHYEWRWKKRSFSSPKRDFNVPMWQGEPLRNRKIVLHAEQGFGDAIQFLRFVPFVAERGATIVLDVPPGLVALLQGFPGGGHVIARGERLPIDVDFHCPLMSLPGLLGITLKNLPAPKAYLKADPVLSQAFLARFPVHQRPRIGLIWAGNPQVACDPVRSPGLRPFLPLFTLDADFFALQVGPGRAQLQSVSLPPNFHDLGEHIRNMADTAAIMSMLDVVVSSCTGPAHLAAALGVPTYIVLAKHADWRWLETRSDSPWYPSVRLFRQKRSGNWDDVIAALRAQLLTDIPLKRD